MKYLLLATTSLTLLLSSCKKDAPPIQLDFIVFGHFYGFCAGEQCREIFKIEAGKLYEDRKDSYPTTSNFYSGNYQLQSYQKYVLVKDLINFFPNDLLGETSPLVGTPDAADGGGYYVEYNIKGVHKFWLIDKAKSKVPDKYHAFMDEVAKCVALLQ
jgi:hypothetical protein